jgi:O-antigen/teichoic acid export membrane protein
VNTDSDSNPDSKKAVSTPTPEDEAADTITEVSPGIFGFPIASWFRAGREGTWIIFCQIMIALAGLVGVRILTELTPKDVLGEATLLLGICMIGRNILVAPLTNAQIRFHPTYLAKGHAEWFTREMARFIWLATSVLMVIAMLALLSWRWIEGPHVSLLLLPAIALYTAVESSKAIRLNHMSAERIRRNPALWSSTEAWLIIGGVAIAMSLSKTTESYLLGFAIATFICLIIFGFIFYRPVHPDLPTTSYESRRELLRKVIRFGAPLVPVAIVSWVSNLGDRYFLGMYLGTEDVGLYAAAYGLASRPILMVSSVLSGFARPILFHADSVGQVQKSARIFKLWVGLTALTTVCGVAMFVVFGGWVGDFFLAKTYREGTHLIFVWVSAGYALFTIGQVLEIELASKHRNMAVLWPSILGAVVNIALNLILIPRNGIHGAAQATTGAFAVQLLALTLALRYRTPFEGKS